MNKKQNRFQRGSFFNHIEKLLQANLDSAGLLQHSVAKGNASEDAWRNLFKCHLPSRYSVESGFVVDAHDNRSEQIDCIIYDKTFTPAFWGKSGYSYILAEAVHAVLEIKKAARTRDLEYASKKIKSVRVLHRTSASYIASGEMRPPKELFPIIGGLVATEISPKIGSPTFDDNMKDKNIDIVLTAHNGYADYFHTGFPAVGPPNKDTSDGASIRGLFRLIQALTEQGTVSAMDIEYYLNSKSV